MRWFIYFFLLLSTPAFGQELRLLDLESLSMEYARIVNNRDLYWPYNDPGRDRYPTSETWEYSVAVNFDLTLLAYEDFRLRWRNRVDGQQTSVQFRTVTWDFRWGLELGEKIELFYDHTSSHILDQAPDSPRTYRLKNFYGVEVTFYKRAQ